MRRSVETLPVPELFQFLSGFEKGPVFIKAASCGLTCGLPAQIADLPIQALKIASERLQFTPESPALLHQRLHVAFSSNRQFLLPGGVSLAAAFTPGLDLFR